MADRAGALAKNTLVDDQCVQWWVHWSKIPKSDRHNAAGSRQLARAHHNASCVSCIINWPRLRSAYCCCLLCILYYSYPPPPTTSSIHWSQLFLLQPLILHPPPTTSITNLPTILLLLSLSCLWLGERRVASVGSRWRGCGAVLVVGCCCIYCCIYYSHKLSCYRRIKVVAFWDLRQSTWNDEADPLHLSSVDLVLITTMTMTMAPIDRDWKELSIGCQIVRLYLHCLLFGPRMWNSGCQAGSRAVGDFLTPFLTGSIPKFGFNGADYMPNR